MGDVKEKRPNRVDSGPIVFDELPPKPVRAAGGQRASEFDGLLDQVHKGNVEGKAVSIRRYGNESAAKAAANVLRQRFGRTIQATGHDFQVRAVEEADGEVLNHLFVIYDPGKIVDGAYEEHVRGEEARAVALEEKRAAKAAQNGS